MLTEQQINELKSIDIPWGEIGYVTYKRTYARRKNDDKINSETEEFVDTIVRVVNSCDRQLNVGFSNAEEFELASMLLKLKGTVAGRFLWQLGTKTVDNLGLPSLQNCAGCVVNEPIRPFTWTMELLMLGCGVGYNIQRENVYQLPKLTTGKKEITRKDIAGADFIVPDTREGWVKLLGKVLKSHFYTGKGFTYSVQLIRSKGAPIKGFGGTASGPDILCSGITDINKILNKRSGKKLRPIDCLDIMNIIGSIVVAGNVRRSAQIAIGDYDDLDFLKAKRWDLDSIPNWRAMSNNSVVSPENLNNLPDEFWQTYKQGEPYGLINLELSRNCGRLNDFRYKDPNVVVYNPCVTGDTEILTKTGYADIKSCVDKLIEVWNGFEWSAVTPKVTGHNQHILKITLSDGRYVKCTDYHKWYISTDYTGDWHKKLARDLKVGDNIVKYNFPKLDNDDYVNSISSYIDLDYSSMSCSVVKIEDFGFEDEVYCFNEPHRHTAIFNGVLTGQCAEQSLENNETCCLADVFLPNITSKSELFKIVQYLYRICKHSLALPCSLPETERIVHKNMRMGIGMTGVLQATDEQRLWLGDCYEMLRQYDVEYSSNHNFPVSIKLTTTKPSGTVSLLPGVTPGIHPSPAGPYYIRRIRMSSDSPLVDMCRKCGYFVEPVRGFDGKNDPTTVVVEFPCNVPDGTPVGDSIGAIRHLELVKWLQTVWSDNSVSCTIYYRQEEFEEIKKWLIDNFNDSLKTVSFLLYQGHGFDQAPYETITKERYDELIKHIKPITNVTMSDFDFDLQDCDNGTCPIK